jgi:alanine racemase
LHQNLQAFFTDRSRAWAEIDLRALQENVQTLVAALSADRRLMAVVKADAYGHGLVPIARGALAAGANWLGVATVFEGVALRSAGIAAPIALLCVPAPDDVHRIIGYRLTPLVGDTELVACLARVDRTAALEVHLDVDTGMGRSGVLPEQVVQLFRQCREAGLRVTGICTHFADADGADPSLTGLQWERFAGARRAAEAAGACFEWVHAGNSAALLRFPPNGCNLVRPGLLVYGLRPVAGEGEIQAGSQEQTKPGEEIGLARQMPYVRPVLALKARVGAVRDLPAGHTISYGATFRLARPSRVATVLIGYGDGYSRRLSNRGEMLIRGGRAPILGRVCMDQTVVDVTEIPGVAAGDIVTCIGSDGQGTITAEEIARRIDTTEHEITTCLTGRLPRLYHND